MFWTDFKTSLNSSLCAHLMLMLSHFGDCEKCSRVAYTRCRSSIITICKRDCFNPGNNRNKNGEHLPQRTRPKHYIITTGKCEMRVHFSSPQQFFFSGKCCSVGEWSVYLWNSFGFDRISVTLMKLMSAKREFHWGIWRLWIVIFHYKVYLCMCKLAIWHSFT